MERGVPDLILGNENEHMIEVSVAQSLGNSDPISESFKVVMEKYKVAPQGGSQNRGSVDFGGMT